MPAVDGNAPDTSSAETAGRNPERDSFVGRAAEIDAIRALFACGHRLVTIVGPAGMGKTRLAQRYLRESAEPAGSRFCDLVSIEENEAFCGSVGHALGIPPESLASARGAADVIGRALEARGPILLVLDNFERLVPAACETVTAWLERSSARLLVTSRVRLRLDAEQVIDLPPLAEGVALFLDRARAAGGFLDPAAADVAAVRAIVERLDGIPLAIELAAARTRILSVPQILSRLERRFAILAAKREGGPPHHATMYAAIDWSWEQLEPHERRALSACAVFPAGFTIEAVEQVLGDGWPAAGPPILDAIESLCDKSLLRVTAPRKPDDPPRFAAYETIRDFAAEQLQRLAEAETLAQRHVAYFLRLSASVTASVVRGAWGEVPVEIARERQNYRSILSRAAQGRSATADVLIAALRAGVVLDATSRGAGLTRLELAAVEAAIAALPEASGQEIVGQALVVCSTNWKRLGESERAMACCSTALETARRRADARLEGLARTVLSLVLLDLGRIDEAFECGAQAQEIHRRTDDWMPLIQDLRIEANALQSSNRLAEARRRYEEIRRMSWQHGFLFGAMAAEAGLGALDLERGLFELSRAHYERALEIARTIGAKRFTILLLGYLGLLHFDHDFLEHAERFLHESVTLARDSGEAVFEGIYGATLAAVRAARGLTREADAGFEKVSGQLAGHAFWVRVTDVHRGHVELAHGRTCAQRGDLDSARIHWQAAAERVAAARAPEARAGAAPGPPLVEVSDDARLAVRILERAIQRRDGGDAGAEKTQAPAGAQPAPRLAAAPDGSWFELAPQGRVSLERRSALKLLLAALLGQRQRSPGVGLDTVELVAAGWPSERLRRASGLNRLRVALATLRTLGLRDVLLHDGHGYLLDPATPLSIVTPDTEARET